MRILIILLVLVAGCVAENPEKSYTVEENGPKTIEVEQEDELDWLADSKEERNALNRDRALREDADDQELWEREKELKNVRRTIDGEVERGYIEEYDDPDFVDVEGSYS